MLSKFTSQPFKEQLHLDREQTLLVAVCSVQSTAPSTSITPPAVLQGKHAMETEKAAAAAALIPASPSNAAPT